MLGLSAREFCGLVYELLYDTRVAAYTGHPKELQEALDALDEELAGSKAVSLSDPSREAAWASYGA